jgi:hypothetical protein
MCNLHSEICKSAMLPHPPYLTHATYLTYLTHATYPTYLTHPTHLTHATYLTRFVSNALRNRCFSLKRHQMTPAG